MIAVAIFMGGSSREREISFAGGRTVYDNLDKNLFSPIPIFIDHEGRLIELRWEYVYKGTIRDFYPPVAYANEGFQVYADSLNLSDSEWQKPISEIGKQISWQELQQKVDLVFLALHGLAGEDGQIQAVLDWYKIPYTGSGLRASAIGMDKSFQKKLMKAAGFDTARFFDIGRNTFINYLNNPKAGADFFAQQVTDQIGDFPVVVRPANQGSSIGVKIVKNAQELFAAIQQAFFVQTITADFWNKLPDIQKRVWLQEFCDIRNQLGFPLTVLETQAIIFQPAALQTYLDNYFSQSDSSPQLHLAAHNSEQTVVVESFIEGKEFSCVVVQNLDGSALALPPTEIVKGKEVFDYRAKYLAGLSRKITPIDLDENSIERIRTEAARLYQFLGFEVYARIDGFFTHEGKIILNDPNTTSGMLPSSFFFHQAAEIGLNPSEFLTFIIHQSIQARLNSHNQLQPKWNLLATRLAQLLHNAQNSAQQRQPVAVLMGGYSSERHISVESGRNVYEKLASSRDYLPIPVFVSKRHTLSGENPAHRLHLLPIRFLLKDNADDIAQKISDCEQADYQTHPILALIRQQAQPITQQFARNNPHFEPQELDYKRLKQLTDLAFIALHGRPGEDGEMQTLLLANKIGFNGSMPDSAAITIDKFRTLQILRQAGLPTAQQLLVKKADYEQNPNAAIAQIEANFNYPLIAKPMDDGCSSAVKLVKNTAQMRAYLNLMFRNSERIDDENAAVLSLKHKEEFPQKEIALIETLIAKEKAAHFLEVTGGLLTHFNPEGEIEYLMFEPSETLASGEILSLEEKFLAGEGQNITPARFVPNDKQFNFSHAHIAQQVKAQLQQAAVALNVTGYARIDAFVRIFEDGKAEVIVIEVNSLPGMTPATCIFHQCAIAGYKPYEFIAAILQFGKIRQQQLTPQLY